MSIMVTGGAGFIGRHLLARLCADRAAFGSGDAPITVLDNFHRSSAEGVGDVVATGAVRLVEADVRDEQALAQAMQGVEYVFHLAAQSNVMGAEDDPEYAYSSNVTGTHRVLQAARAAGARRVVLASSREVYGQPDSIPVAETETLAPKNTYGASKAAAEMLCRVAAARGGLEVVALRMANVYGPGDAGRVIPLWLDRAVRGEELLVYGGRQVMDLIWVGDIVNALIRAALAPRATFVSAGLAPAESDAEAGAGFFAALNAGTGHGTRLSTLIEHIRALVDRPVAMRVLPARPAEVERFVADATLLRAVLGVRPDPPLSHLHTLVEEALQRQSGTPATMASRHPHLTLVAREGH
jgi:UDP-glucose 4-epimerase